MRWEDVYTGMLRGLGPRSDLIVGPGLQGICWTCPFCVYTIQFQEEKIFWHSEATSFFGSIWILYHSSISREICFVLVEKRYVSQWWNSSWCNGVGNFLTSVWHMRAEILYDNESIGEVSWTTPTPEYEVNGTEC